MISLERPELLRSGQRWSAWKTPWRNTVLVVKADASSPKGVGGGQRQGSERRALDGSGVRGFETFVAHNYLFCVTQGCIIPKTPSSSIRICLKKISCAEKLS